MTAKATDFAQGNVRHALEPIRRANPSRPVVLCITTLHEAIPRQPLPTPYPFGKAEGGGGKAEEETKDAPPSPLRLPPSVPDDLRRCMEEHARAFEGLYDALVPIDLTRPEDQFPDPHYGGEELKATLFRLLPEAYRQTLLRLKEATDALKDIHLRHAVPVILGYSTMAATAGAVPVPFVDMIVIPGIQARMAHHIAGVYGQPMTTERFKEIAAAVGVGHDVATTRPAGDEAHPGGRLGGWGRRGRRIDLRAGPRPVLLLPGGLRGTRSRTRRPSRPITRSSTPPPRSGGSRPGS